MVFFRQFLADIALGQLFRIFQAQDNVGQREDTDRRRKRRDVVDRQEREVECADSGFVDRVLLAAELPVKEHLSLVLTALGLEQFDEFLAKLVLSAAVGIAHCNFVRLRGCVIGKVE